MRRATGLALVLASLLVLPTGRVAADDLGDVAIAEVGLVDAVPAGPSVS